MQGTYFFTLKILPGSPRIAFGGGRLTTTISPFPVKLKKNTVHQIQYKIMQNHILCGICILSRKQRTCHNCLDVMAEIS